MSFIDIFAWIVLLVLVATVVAIFVALGMMPGRIARKRGHPWPEAVTVGSWATLIFGFVFWPLVLIWAYVDVPARRETSAMIVVLLNAYIALLALFVWLRFIPFNLFWKLSPVIVLLVLLVGLFIPMGWGAPSGPAAVIRNSVQIIPSVAGEVVDVPVAANTPVKEGDVLFRIDPTTYQAQVAGDRGAAQVRRAALSPVLRAATPRHRPRLRRAAARSRGRPTAGAARRRQVEPRQDHRAGAGRRLRDQPGAAQGRARHRAVAGDGLHRHVGDHLRRGDPADLRALRRGRAAGRDHVQDLPGRGLPGKVETVLQAIATGQSQPGGLAVTPSEVQAAPFIVRIRLDDQEVAKRLPAGSTGLAAIFTDHVKASHVIRQVVLRQTAILNYVNPF